MTSRDECLVERVMRNVVWRCSWHVDYVGWPWIRDINMKRSSGILYWAVVCISFSGVDPAASYPVYVAGILIKFPIWDNKRDTDFKKVRGNLSFELSPDDLEKSLSPRHELHVTREQSRVRVLFLITTRTIRTLRNVSALEWKSKSFKRRRKLVCQRTTHNCCDIINSHVPRKNFRLVINIFMSRKSVESETWKTMRQCEQITWKVIPSMDEEQQTRERFLRMRTREGGSDDGGKAWNCLKLGPICINRGDIWMYPFPCLSVFKLFRFSWKPPCVKRRRKYGGVHWDGSFHEIWRQ